MSDPVSYKKLKEDFVSNLSGGSVTEINYVTSVAAVSPSPPRSFVRTKLIHTTGCGHSLGCPPGPPIVLPAVHTPCLCRRFPPQCRRHPPLHDPLCELSSPPHPAPDRPGRLRLHPTAKFDRTEEKAQGSTECADQVWLGTVGRPFHQAIPHYVPG